VRILCDIKEKARTSDDLTLASILLDSNSHKLKCLEEKGNDMERFDIIPELTFLGGETSDKKDFIDMNLENES
jgi:hypothetical protein